MKEREEAMLREQELSDTVQRLKEGEGNVREVPAAGARSQVRGLAKPKARPASTTRLRRCFRRLDSLYLTSPDHAGNGNKQRHRYAHNPSMPMQSPINIVKSSTH